jgi:hypothetical protein
MVTRLAALLVLAALARPVHADDDDAGFNMLSLDTSFGAVHAERMSSVGIAVEHPVWRTLRVVAYDWVWLGDGSGHRATLGLRRELLGVSNYHSHLFVDGELGASLAMLTPPEMGGVELMPAGFVGLRFGWDLYTGRDESPSQMFETAVAVRVLAIDHTAGVTAGVTFAWGN